MDRQLRGKFLVRRSKTNTGKEVLTLTGTFHPVNFNISDVNSADEMWVADVIVCEGGFKFTDCLYSHGVGSPEDFLEGNCQKSSDWQKKELL